MNRSVTPFALALLLSSSLAAQVVPRIRVAERVSQAFVIERVQPKYPQDAKSVEGSVVLKAEISKEGDVTQLDVVSGHPLLVPAALKAAKQWKYKPYLLNKQPVAIETQITLDFHLNN